MVTLREDSKADEMAGAWLKAHRHGLDTSEAFDELRDLLADARRLAVTETLDRVAKLCDSIAVKTPDNRHATNPRAAYQAGAAKCAWEIRQLQRGPL
jgi:hypothetical protein